MAPDVVSTADTQSKGLSRLGFLAAWHESKEISKFHYDMRIDPKPSNVSKRVGCLEFHQNKAAIR